MIAKIKQRPAIVILLAVNLIIGILIVSDYGESWDEHLHVEYANSTADTYRQVLQGNFGYRDFRPTNLRYYGPAFNLFTRFAVKLFSQTNDLTVAHFTYFLAFQIGIASLYFLCLKVMTRPAAFSATLLFTTQPLLWGHAFINPKDIPFMALFIASVAAGIHFIDRLQAQDILTDTPAADTSLRQQAQTGWQAASPKTKTRLKTLVLICTIGFIFLTLGQSWLQSLAAQAAAAAYTAAPESALGKLFAALAQNAHAIPLENYTAKAAALTLKLSLPAIVLLLLLPVITLIYALAPFRQTAARHTRQLFANIKTTLKHPASLTAAILLGITTAIRITGPIAGTLIAAYALVKLGKKALGPILAYVALAVLTTYLLWPFLWSDPITHFFYSLFTLSDFPWGGRVLFAGGQFPTDQLPRSYLPTLLALQFTEPVIPLALFGAFITLKTKPRRPLALLLLAWFLIPFLYLIISSTNLYDNFRQLLFITPPLFIAAGWALQAVFQRISKPIIQSTLTAALLLPGILAIIQLHPYQYIYYNTFIGGVENAFRNYETDYWGTAFTQAGDWLNHNAPQDAKIVVFGPEHIVQHVARPDLIVEPNAGGTYELTTGYDYAVINTRLNKDPDIYPNEPIIYAVEIDGAVLAVIKILNCTQTNPCNVFER